MAVDFNSLLKELTEFGLFDIRIGFQKDELSDDGVSLAQIAAWQEFGTPTSPQRPFLTSALDEGRGSIAKQFEIEMGAVLDGTRTALKAASRLGIFGATLVKKRIRDSRTWAEPNTDATKDKKGSSKPLVDTGGMLGAVTWSVTKKGSVIASG